MQMIPMMQVVMAAFPIALQEFLSRDVLASCSVLLIYIDLCCMFGVLFKISPYCYSTWYLVPFRAAASHVKICQTSNMKESGSI